jgi:hypothetical protein
MSHVVTQRSNSKRAPYPYDLYLGMTKLMLEPASDGNLVAQRSKTLDATAPIDYTYSSANPFKERTFEWTKLYGGYGQIIEHDLTPRRYEHAEYVDTSINGTMFKGPKFYGEAASVPMLGLGKVYQFIWAMHGGAEVLFAICDTGVARRTSDSTWVVSFGSLPTRQAVRFKSRTAGKLDCLYVTEASGNLWEYDGTTWNFAAVAGGPGTGTANGEARYIEKVQDELWVAGDYWVVKTTAGADPLLRSSWAGVIWVGDQSAHITNLKQINNSLYIFKEDGLYTITDTGECVQLLALPEHYNLQNGKGAAVWMDRMWAPFGDRVYTIDASGNMKPDGTEQILENQSFVRGQWVAGAGHNTWFMYEIYYNALTADSYLIKHGTWVESTASQNIVPGLAQFADAHHGAVYIWNNKQVTACEIINNLEAAGNDRLYVGFSDGSVDFCVLPRSSPNPTIDSACTYTLNDSYVYLPVHHLGYQADNKLYRGATAVGSVLSTLNTLEIQYRFDIVNPSATWVSLDPADPLFTLPNERKEFPNNTYAKLIQMRLKLVGTPGGSTTPVIDGIAVHQALRPSLSLEWTFSVKLADGLVKHNGTTDRRRGSMLRDEVQNVVAYAGNIDVTLPTGDVETMTLIDYRESAANWSKRRNHEWLAQITGIQLRTLSSPAVGAAGLTYGTLEHYTYGQLEGII